jgi:nucleoside-diphosphate-sugar epimerase
MKSVLITGGTGFIGSYIAKKLLAKGYKVVLYDASFNFSSTPQSTYDAYLKHRLKDLDKAIIVKGDTRNKADVIKAVNDYNPSSIIHLAALPISTTSNKNPEDATSINLYGTVNVLETIRNCDSIKRFVFASSSMVYGNFQKEPAPEEHPTCPIDVYGGTKLSGEILTKVYSKQYGVEYTIIRPSAVYGPTDVNRRVSQIFVENALNSKPIILHNGGMSKLDFSYVEDVAEGFVLALESKQAINKTFNITRGEGRSLKEFAEILKSLIPNIKIEEMPAPKDEVRPERGALDITKAKKLLNYNPQYSLEKGLPKYVEFIKNFQKK